MPPAYPAEDFVVPEGVVGIFKGAFDGCHFRTITFPQSLQLTPHCFLRYARNLECIFVSSKVMNIEGITGLGYMSKPNFEIKCSSSDNEVLESWKECLGIYLDNDVDDTCDTLLDLLCRLLKVRAISSTDGCRIQ